ncbi:MAG: ISAs1 family transposase [Desulfovibrio sp.]|nr:ISAs1 family transposase [Desulfovibrio sp.]
MTKTVEEKNTTSNETQYYICSFTDIERFKKVQRQHWRIESMHWDLDVVFNEDACRVKKGFAPSNLNILRKVALCILQKAKDAAHRYVSKITLQKRCHANPENILKILAFEPLC